MSFENLGKIKSIWEQLADDLLDNESADEFDFFAKAIKSYPKFKSMSPVDLANLLESAGLNGDEIKHTLSKMDIADDIIEGLFDSSDGKLKTPDSLKDRFKNIKTGIIKEMDKLKKTVKGFGSFLLTPAGLGLTVGIAATAAIAYAGWANSFEHLSDVAAESKAALEETTSEIESMNSEYETTKARIEELISLGENRSAAEDDELQKLREQNDLLEAQLNYQRSILALKQQDAVSDARKALTTGQFSIGNSVTITDSGIVLPELVYQDPISALEAKQSELMIWESLTFNPAVFPESDSWYEMAQRGYWKWVK